MLLPGQQPGGREPAPGPLRIVQRFVNTVDLEHGNEEWPDAERLAGFLAEQELGSGLAVTDADLRRAIELREAIRALLRANNGLPPQPGAAAVIEHAARAAQLTVVMEPDGSGALLMAQAPGVDGALGQVVATMFTCMADGSWRRLKACRRDVCRWAFYDHSRNRSGAWCTMAICGNRTKTRSYRRRREA
jgi:predicted RNA-binding Zn ribbon-like protein